MYWLARRTPNDQFLLYCFDGAQQQPELLREFVVRRSAQIADLTVRIRDVPFHVDYPYWERAEFGSDQIVEHELAEPKWRDFTTAVAALLTTALDPRVSPWRLHIFRGVQDAPRCDDRPALIAVLQVSHALADGKRASSIARALFAPDDPEPLQHSNGRILPDALLVGRGVAEMPARFGVTFVRGLEAYRASKALADLVSSGEIPPENRGQKLTLVNSAPGPRRVVRMIVCPAPGLRAPDVTVTVAVLTAISVALVQYLELHGAEPSQRLGAEVPISAERTTNARNSFGNVGVDLYPDEPDLRARAHKIGRALQRRRQRARHSLMAVQDRVTQAVPALGMWHEVNSYPFDTIPPLVSGNTVVSSVFRGRDDLRLGGGKVVFTAGFPSLSPVMALTHGAHGIGDTVTISVTASPDVMPDVDVYEDMLRGALVAVGKALA